MIFETQKVQIPEGLTLEWLEKTSAAHIMEFAPVMTELPENKALLKKLLDGSASQEYIDKNQDVLRKLVELYNKYNADTFAEPANESPQEEDKAEEEESEVPELAQVLMESLMNTPVDIKNVSIPNVSNKYGERTMLISQFCEANDIPVKKGRIVPADLYAKFFAQ